MKKKQLLATLVMLSLMQGSVYAETVNTTLGEGTFIYNEDTTLKAGLSLTGEKQTIITVKDGTGTLTFDGGSRGIDMSSNKPEVTINANVVFTNQTWDGINFNTGDEQIVKINGNLDFENMSVSAVKGQNGASAEGTGLVVDGKITADNVNVKSGADGAIFAFYGTNVEAKGLEVKNSSLNKSDYGGVIFLNSSARINIKNDQGNAELKISNIENNTTSLITGIYGNTSNTYADKIIIENIDNNNGKSAMAIYNCGQNTITSKNITVSQIYSNKNDAGSYSVGILQEGDNPSRFTETKLETNNLTICDIKSVASEAYGLNSMGYSEDNGNLSTIVHDTVDISKVQGYLDTVGVLNLQSSDLDVTNNLFVTDITSETGKGVGAWFENDKTNIGGLLQVTNIKGKDLASGVVVAGSKNFEAQNLYIDKIQADKYVVGFDIKKAESADVNSVYINANHVVNNMSVEGYHGNYDGESSANEEILTQIALRANEGGKIDWTDSEGNYIIHGAIVAGWGSDEGDIPGVEGPGTGGSINPPSGPPTGLSLYSNNETTAGNIRIGADGATTQIYGDVFAGNGGNVEITLSGTDSVLEGQVDDYHELANDDMKDKVFHNSAFVDSEGKEIDVVSAGAATLNINNGGQWIARGQSFVDTISLDGGIIDMSKNENSSVTVDKLSSNNGVLKMKLNTNDRTQSDMLYVTGSMSGNYQLIIDETNFDASETEIDPLRFATVKGDVDISGINARSVDVGFFDTDYKIFTEDFVVGDEDNKVYNNSGVEGNDDHAADYKPGNGFAETTFNNDDTNLMIGGIEKQTVSDAGQTIINMSRANYSNAIYMDRLNKRMGEARYINPEDEQGMWVRLRHDRIGKTDAFRSQNTMYEMGYDVKQDCDNGERRIGMAIDYMDGKTEYRNVAGDGDIKRYGLWLYDTWTGNKGHYTDFVAKWGHLENDFEIYNSLGKVNGDYSNNVFSVSAEYGKKNDMGNNWYFEPQAQLQLARVTGADYVTSQNTKVSLDGINSLIGRAGFRLGRDLDENSTVYVKADLLHEFLGDQTISAYDITTNGVYCETFENKGTWYDVGFGFATALGKNSYAFMDFEKSFGNDNDETYQVNAGVQWTF